MFKITIEVDSVAELDQLMGMRRTSVDACETGTDAPDGYDQAIRGLLERSEEQQKEIACLRSEAVAAAKHAHQCEYERDLAMEKLAQLEFPVSASPLTPTGLKNKSALKEEVKALQRQLAEMERNEE